MKKSFIIKFPIKQIISSGMSWSQVNELSWVEVNLLSWRDLIAIAKRYLSYSIRSTKIFLTQASLAIKKTFKTRGSYVPK
jgi:hypothetical protein